jgi:hypothetical protein
MIAFPKFSTGLIIIPTWEQKELAWPCTLKKNGFQQAIHRLEDGYFRNKFENDITGFKGNIGIGVISDTEAQPIQVTSHMGKFAVATVCSRT